MCVICDPSGERGFRPCSRCAQTMLWSDYAVACMELLDSRLRALEGAEVGMTPELEAKIREDAARWQDGGWVCDDDFIRLVLDYLPLLLSEIDRLRGGLK